MTEPKYFWCLSNRKTVKEISWEEWRNIAKTDWKRENNTRLIGYLSNSEFYIRKGQSYVHIPIKQLQQILEASE